MFTNSDEDIAANARSLVARKQLRQGQIAAALNLTQSQVSRRLAGQVRFTPAELQALAQLLEVPVATLYGEQVSA